MRMSDQKREFIPELRFSEFLASKGWKIRSVSETCDKPFSGGTPSSTKKEYYGGDIPFIRSGEIDKEKTDLFLTQDGLSNSSAKLVKKGDILVALYGANSGEVALSKIEGAINQAILCLRSRTNNVFLFQYLVFRKNYITNRYLQGGQGNLSGDIIKSIELLFPERDEQQKIADCLASIDELITLHTQKLEALKFHKKGLMQQLFPAQGETVPRLRFPEFRKAGCWKLKPIGKVLVEKQRPIDMEEDEEYSLVTVKRRYGGLVSRGIYKGSSIKVKSQFEVHENDFLISKRQIVHCACGVVPKELHGSIVSNEYSVLVPKKDNDVHFFDYFAQQPEVSLSFLQCSIGIVIEKMLFKLKDWLKEEFLFPEIEEQQKIAQFLGDFDEIIDKQSQKIESLKEHKKGLMQKLFPVMDEVV